MFDSTEGISHPSPAPEEDSTSCQTFPDSSSDIEHSRHTLEALPSLPSLPDDVWGKVLCKAGTPVLLVCRHVNTQLQRVTQQLLEVTRQFDVTHHFEQFSNDLSSIDAGNCRKSLISEHDVMSIIRAFPTLADLSLIRWPFHDTRPDIASLVVRALQAPSSVRQVELRHVYLNPAIIHTLFNSCPGLRGLSLGSHDSVNNVVVRAVVQAAIAKQIPGDSKGRGVFSTYTGKRERIKRRLDILSITDTKKVGDNAIDTVLSSRVTKHVTLSELPGLKIVKVRAFAMWGVNVTKCSNLAAVKVRCGMVEGDEDIRWDEYEDCVKNEVKSEREKYMKSTSIITGPDLDLSENRNLRTVTFEITASEPDISRTGLEQKSNKYPVPPLSVCTANSLNLSFCSQLVYIYMRRAREDEHVGSDERPTYDDDFFNGDGTVRCKLPFLTNLNLYGARKLLVNTFSNSLGLSTRVAVNRLPKLSKLVLTGTTVERLDLKGFEQLEYVEVSGSMLKDIVVERCPQLHTLLLAGRRMPLIYVALTLPPHCKVSGCRNDWAWEQYTTHQSITFDVSSMMIRY